MNNLDNYHLVVSRDKRTWKTPFKNFFAGYWCFKKNEIKEINIDDVIDSGKFNPEDDEFVQQDKIYSEINSIRDQIINDLSNVLNQYHNVNMSNRFYKIILGYWFDWAIELIINRQVLLKKILSKVNIKTFSYIDSNKYFLAPYNTINFINAQYDDRWNQLFFSELIKVNEDTNIELIKITDDKESLFSKPIKIFKDSGILFCLNKCIFFMNKIFMINKAPFIINSYLSKKNELILNSYFYRVPFLWWNINFSEHCLYDSNLRKILGKKLLNQNDNNNTRLVKLLIFKIFPICYLECYPKLDSKTNNLPWPKYPKFIFTSNAFFGDEIFKLWTGKKVEEGTEYYAGQHGGKYGWMKNYIGIEEITSNKFITWGWKNDNEKYIKSFNFTQSVKNKLNSRNHGNILIVKAPLVYFGYRKFFCDSLWNLDNNYYNYRNKLLDLVKNLNLSIQKIIIIRLYKDNTILKLTQSNIDDKIFWEKNFSSRQVDKGFSNFEKLIKKTQLMIVTYDSTIILNHLNRNIPMIIIFENFMIKQLNTHALKFFNILKENKILYTDYELAKNFICTNFNNYDNWWNSKKIVDARKIFCKEYSQTAKNPAKELFRILNKQTNEF